MLIQNTSRRISKKKIIGPIKQSRRKICDDEVGSKIDAECMGVVVMLVLVSSNE